MTVIKGGLLALLTILEGSTVELLPMEKMLTLPYGVTMENHQNTELETYVREIATGLGLNVFNVMDKLRNRKTKVFTQFQTSSIKGKNLEKYRTLKREIQLLNREIRHSQVHMANIGNLAIKFYRKEYLSKIAIAKGTKFEVAFFSLAINMGTKQATKLAQRVLKVNDDGQWGRRTNKAYKDYDNDLFMTIHLMEEGYKFYRSLVRNNRTKFGWAERGFMNRVDRVLKVLEIDTSVSFMEKYGYWKG